MRHAKLLLGNRENPWSPEVLKLRHPNGGPGSTKKDPFHVRLMVQGDQAKLRQAAVSVDDVEHGLPGGAVQPWTLWPTTLHWLVVERPKLAADAGINPFVDQSALKIAQQRPRAVFTAFQVFADDPDSRRLGFPCVPDDLLGNRDRLGGSSRAANKDVAGWAVVEEALLFTKDWIPKTVLFWHGAK